MKSGNFNFLEPSGQLQACNGTALPLPFTYTYFNVKKLEKAKALEYVLAGCYSLFVTVWLK